MIPEMFHRMKRGQEKDMGQQAIQLGALPTDQGLADYINITVAML